LAVADRVEVDTSAAEDRDDRVGLAMVARLPSGKAVVVDRTCSVAAIVEDTVDSLAVAMVHWLVVDTT
jgi:hypothetical protein